MSEHSRFEELLDAGRAGDEKARDELFSQVYEDLKHVATSHLRRSGHGVTISPTTLVHEAYLKLPAPEITAWKIAVISSMCSRKRCDKYWSI